MDGKWHLNRAGLLNYWYFDEMYFNFADGKVLFRGANGSGKSVTTASLFPVLLDGNTAPNRLDPFGSTARKIEDYLLGEKEISNIEDRTGYLFAEYKRENSSQYITTGIGIRAKRGKSLDKWYFIILDGSRVGINFELQHSLGRGRYQPYSKKELENRLAGGGMITDKMKDYAEWVNEKIYGFNNTEIFKEMIKLLVEIRKPKLSKDFTPTVIYSILENSLPGLKDEALQPVSETLENIDQIKNQLEGANSDYEKLSLIMKKYEAYNRSFVEKLAHYAHKTGNTYVQLTKEDKALTDSIEKLTALISAKGDEQTEALQERKALEEALDRLKTHDVFKLQNEMLQEQSRTEELKQKEKNLQGQYTQSMNAYRDEQNKFDSLQKRIAESEEEKQLAFENLNAYSADTGFKDEHTRYTAEYQTKQNHMDLSLWKRSAKDYENDVRTIQSVLEKMQTLQADSDKLQIDIASMQKEIDKKTNEIQNWEQMFSEQIDILQIDIEKWCNGAGFEITDDVRNQMQGLVYNLYKKEFALVQNLAKASYEHYHEKMLTEKISLEQEVRFKETELAAVQKELHEWKNKKIPEPARDAFKEKERTSLKEAGLPFISFYEVVDFKEGLSQEEKNVLEGALLDAGILDALLSEKNLPVRESSVLLPSDSIIEENLEKYLVPVQNKYVSTEYIQKILHSISIKETFHGAGSLFAASAPGAATTVSIEGKYNLGILSGKVTEKHEAKYIGKEAQILFIQKKIAELEQTQADINAEIESRRTAIENIENDVAAQQEHLQNFPSDTALREIDASITEAEKERRDFNDKKAFYESEERKTREAIGEQRRRLLEYESKHHFTYTEKNINELIRKIGNYCLELDELKILMQNILSLTEQAENSQTHIRREQERMDDCRIELDETQGALAVGLRKIRLLEEELKLAGQDEIIRKVTETAGRKKYLDDELLPNLAAEIKDAEIKKARTEEKSKRIAAEKLFYEQLSSEWQKLFERELFRYDEKTDEDIPALIKQWAKNFDTAAPDKYIKYSDEIHAYINKSIQELGDYRPEINTLPAIDTQAAEALAETDEFKTAVEFLRSFSKRDLLTVTNIQNKRDDIFRVVKELKSYIEEQEQMIEEKDKDLFESLLLESTGKTIKNLINDAEKWAQKMNAILQRQNNYRGLKLFIEWKPKAAEDEQEVGTKELVELLRRPAKSLTEDDIQKVVHHFRSKIEKAKIDMEKDEQLNSLHDIIKQVLDYRKWFQFIIHYEKDNQTKRELSNHVFNKFSGGEKAISMYLPLFTAMYSRYEDASKNAPYVVVLDEAFAGVDEMNIAELFKAMEDLGFDYVLNSQSLWGDYPTVKNLVIHQLIRERGSDMVVSQEYRWNGTERTEVDAEIETEIAVDRE
ncbi:TIGR02680 family protein [Treponema phagedenis]|uniref:TIGR02680 family protein n=1 Tax=Treponema phagedenis TaxID=162 RepID=UPI00046454F6|nr:TIGR02680 family protein [Treponema phagedenis]NVP24339.1 TIGR02680 family protein [Treponema phagedenis]QKS91623.1 TIGR02680 family protein [Treponema phagedenis]QLC59843.1 TIGR02680 family protein [Treponema phagedenis]